MVLDSTHKSALLFPGQGSQSVGMLAQVANLHPEIKATFDEASQVLNYDLWELISVDPENKINQTEYTQPALLAAGVSLWRVCQKTYPDLNIAALAGHSLGEYTALVCAQSLQYKTAIDLVAKRGAYMQQACPADEGAMAAIIGLDDAVVESLCSEHAEGEIVSPANYNSVGQVVIAGDKQAVFRVVDAAKPAGAKLAKILPVSAPSHCLLMKSAADELTELLNNTAFLSPKIMVIHNVDAKAYQHPDQIRQALAKQLYNPVLWVDTIKKIQSMGVTHCYECGPGNVLTGLTKRITKAIAGEPLEKVLQQDKQYLT